MLLFVCYFLWLFASWYSFFWFSCLLTVVLSNPESILICLLSFWLLNAINIIMVVLHYSILLLNCIIVDYFIIIIYLVLLLLFSLYFNFRCPMSFTSTFLILFHIALHLLFYLVFTWLNLLLFLSLFIPCNLLSWKCEVKTSSCILSFLWTYMKKRFIFLSLFSRGYV